MSLPSPPAETEIVDIPFVEWDDFLAGFRWKQGEHLTMLGPTGQGKTTLARELLPRRKFVVVLVTKKRDKLIDRFKADGYETVREFFGNVGHGTRYLLWPKFTKGLQSKQHQREVFQQALDTVFAQEGWTVYLDEIRQVTERLGLAADVEELLQQGRSMGITIIGGTQRPSRIPLAFYDQPEHVFFWRDNDYANLKRIAELNASISSKFLRSVVASLPRHEFLYVNTRTSDLVRSKVRV